MTNCIKKFMVKKTYSVMIFLHSRQRIDRFPGLGQNCIANLQYDIFYQASSKQINDVKIQQLLPDVRI